VPSSATWQRSLVLILILRPAENVMSELFLKTQKPLKREGRRMRVAL
jgi:hypothetical protein